MNQHASHSRVVARLGAALTAALALSAGCAPSSSDDASEATAHEAEPIASALRACPPSARYAVISSGDLACPDVAGDGGAWRASAPAAACVPKRATAEASSFFCLYEWAPSASRSDAPPDVGALESIPFAFVAPIDDAEGDPTCGYGTFSPWLAAQDMAGVVCPFGPRGPNGPKGCDVCGLPMYPGVIGGFLVVPATTPARTVAVGTTSGGEQLFLLDAARSARSSSASARPRSQAPYAVIQLPSLPHGVRWVEGAARGYGYDSPPAGR